MNDGFIKINRKILEWEWYKDINTKTVFIHMLFRTNWKTGKFKGRDIPRGSFVSSYEQLAKETALSIQQVRTAVKHLKTTGEITSVGYSEYSIFSITNYDEYQSLNRQSSKKVTIEQQETTKQLTMIQELKNVIKEEKIYSENHALNKSIKEFIDYRNDIKAPMTDRAILLLISRLSKITEIENEQIEILNQSMLNGWKGIFELKKIESSKSNQNKFNNFCQRSYDFDKLEKQLIGNNE